MSSLLSSTEKVAVSDLFDTLGIASAEIELDERRRRTIDQLTLDTLFDLQRAVVSPKIDAMLNFVSTNDVDFLGTAVIGPLRAAIERSIDRRIAATEDAAAPAVAAAAADAKKSMTMLKQKEVIKAAALLQRVVWPKSVNQKNSSRWRRTVVSLFHNVIASGSQNGGVCWLVAPQAIQHVWESAAANAKLAPSDHRDLIWILQMIARLLASPSKKSVALDLVSFVFDPFAKLSGWSRERRTVLENPSIVLELPKRNISVNLHTFLLRCGHHLNARELLISLRIRRNASDQSNSNNDEVDLVATHNPIECLYVQSHNFCQLDDNDWLTLFLYLLDRPIPSDHANTFDSIRSRGAETDRITRAITESARSIPPRQRRFSTAAFALAQSLQSVVGAAEAATEAAEAATGAAEAATGAAEAATGASEAATGAADVKSATGATEAKAKAESPPTGTWEMPMSSWSFWSHRPTLFHAVCCEFGVPKSSIQRRPIENRMDSGFNDESIWFTLVTLSDVTANGFVSGCAAFYSESQTADSTNASWRLQCECVQCNVRRRAWHLARNAFAKRLESVLLTVLAQCVFGYLSPIAAVHMPLPRSTPLQL
jgi:hypothetical protein